MKYFILGLPRSRTYWMSKFLGCVHEAVYWFEDYKDFMDSKQEGDSTTAYPLIMDHVDGHKKVIIHRDINDVKKSLKKLFGDRDYSHVDLSAHLLMDEDGLHVRYEDIDDRLEEIWKYCKGTPFPKERAEQMKGQVLNNDFLISEVKKCL